MNIFHHINKTNNIYLIILSVIIVFQSFPNWIVTMNLQNNLEFFLTEECPPNTIVGNLNSLPFLTQTNNYLTATHFQLLTQTAHFYLNETTGLLTTRGRIDRESFCANHIQPNNLHHQTALDFKEDKFELDLPNTNCEVRLQILQLINDLALQSGQTTITQKSQTELELERHRVILVKIHILDINDNAPKWHEQVIQLSIPEHTPIGTRISLPLATDPDCGPMNTTVGYSIILRSKRLTNPNTDIGNNNNVQNIFQLDAELANTPQLIMNNMWNYRVQLCNPRIFNLWLRITQDLDCDYDETDLLSNVNSNLKEIRSGDTLNTALLLDDNNNNNIINKDTIDLKLSQTDLNQIRSYQHHQQSVRLKNLELLLIATDGGQPTSLTGSVTINITITDINDHSPEFVSFDTHRQSSTSSSTSSSSIQQQMQTKQLENGDILIKLPENTPAGRTIYQVLATDRDMQDQNRLKYAFDSSTSLDVKETFRINSKTGEITLIRSPDYEKYQSHVIPITVTDGKYLVSQKVIVQIENLNDHPPMILVRPVGQSKTNQMPTNYMNNFINSRTVALHVTEHDPPNKFIATVTVSDLDEVNSPDENVATLDKINTKLNYHSSSTINEQYQNKIINCQLSHTGLRLESLFQGAWNQFKLLTQTSFDREQQSEQFATLTCFDRGQPPLSSQIGLRIIIDDINDHGPILKQTKMITHLKENSPPGTKIYKIDAYDPDIGINAQLGYQLGEQYTEDFMIDSKTGTISSLKPFDREQIEQFNLSIIVYDQSNHFPNGSVKSHNTPSVTHLQQQHIAHGNLYVKIDDVNDCVPTFEHSLYQLTVSEDAKINHLIGQVEANDSDITEANNQIHYLIKPQSESQSIQEFRVSSKGYIYVARGNLDREKIPAYNFFLVAIDSGSPPLSSSTQVHILLIDVNDNPPQWIFPVHNHQIINLTINEPVGYRVAQLLAEDPDENENREVIYRLLQTSVMVNMPEVDRGLGAASPTTVRNDLNNANLSPKSSSSRYVPVQNVGNLFELDSISGAIYVGRSMSTDDIGSIKLVLEASDRGRPAKINHRVLQIDIFRYLPQSNAHLISDNEVGNYVDAENGKYRTHISNNGNYLENDLIVIVIMVAVTLIISLILILAILFLRCGICANRDRINCEQNDARFYRQNLNHTHHLEEVFRDSGMLEADGLLSTNNDQMVDCKRLSEDSLATYPHHLLHHYHHQHHHHSQQQQQQQQQPVETDTMMRSVLSSPDGNQWMISTLDSKKHCLDTMRSHKVFSTQTPFHQSPTKGNDTMNTNKCDGKSVLVGRLKRVDERLMESSSVKNSPSHELKVLTNSCSIPGQINQTCSTFRATNSCSQLPGYRLNSALCRDPDAVRNLNSPNEALEDMESMDSGRGCSTDTGNLHPFEGQGVNIKTLNSNNNPTPTGHHQSSCYCALAPDNIKGSLRIKSPELFPNDTDEVPLKVLANRRRSGTLPSNAIGSLGQDTILQGVDGSTKLSVAKSSGDLLKTDPRCCLKYNQEQPVKGRLSVTWLDSHPRLNDQSPQFIEERNILGQLNNEINKETCSEITQTTDDTMVLFSPIDQLGYAQLIHAQTADRHTPTQNIYTKFPTNFV